MEYVEKLFRKTISNDWLYIILILLVGLALRLYKIDSPVADWHSFRQADTASVTRYFVDNGINMLIPRYHDVSSIQSGIRNLGGYRFVEFPFYNLIHAILVKSFSFYSLEVWGRLVSVISSLVSCLLLYLIGKSIYNRYVGLLSSFYFAVIPFNVYYSRVILPEPLSNVLCLFSLYLVLEFTKNKNMYSFILSAVALSLAALIRPFSVLYLIPISYLLINKYGLINLIKRSNWWVRVSIYIFIILAPFFLWRWWIDKHPEGVPFYLWIFNYQEIRFHPAFWRWLFIERVGNLILGVWGVIPFVLGLVIKSKNNYFAQSMLLLIIFYLSIFAAGNVRHDYYQVFIIPAISLIMGIGAYKMITAEYFNRYLSLPILIFSIGIMLLNGIYKVKDYYQINRPEIIEAGKYLDSVAPKEALVIAPYFGDTALLYQTRRWGWPEVDDSIENLRRYGADYFVSVDFSDDDYMYVSSKYKVLEKNDKFAIVDLNKSSE